MCAVVDPTSNGRNLVGRQRLAWRHLEVAGVCDSLVEQALIRIPRHDGGAALATFCNGVDAAEIQAGCLGLSVAVEAAVFENGFGGGAGGRCEGGRRGQDN
jgi:hypothetical protein